MIHIIYLSKQTLRMWIQYYSSPFFVKINLENVMEYHWLIR